MSLIDVCYELRLPRTPDISITYPQGAADNGLRTADLLKENNII